MLWQTGVNTGIYIDLLENIKYEKLSYRLHRKKSNVLSLKIRMEGNDKYGQNDSEGAKVHV